MFGRVFLYFGSFSRCKLPSFRYHQFHFNDPSLIFVKSSLFTTYNEHNALLNGGKILPNVITFRSNNKNNESNDHCSRIQWRWDIITTLLALLGVAEQPKDSPLIESIKRGILAKQRKQYHQAELILHGALKIAQDLSNTDAETYVFDVLADNYFEKGNHSKAMDLYLVVLSRLSKKKDFRLDGEEMVEISIKLAYCFSRLNQQDSAEKGFQFSIDTQLLRTEPYWNDKKSELLTKILDEEQRNSLALLGMAYDYYSKHLEKLSSQLLERALVYRLKALKISTVINGENHVQTLILENDIADLYAQMEKYEMAKTCLRRAIDKAKDMQAEELPMLYLNLASIYCQENRQDLAKKFCQKTLDLVSNVNKQQEKSFEVFTEKNRLELLKKSELCLNGLKFY